MRALLALQEKPELSCKSASDLASAQLSAVEGRINRLTVLREELKRMIRACKNKRVFDCRVIDALTKMP